MDNMPFRQAGNGFITGETRPGDGVMALTWPGLIREAWASRRRGVPRRYPKRRPRRPRA